MCFQGVASGRAGERSIAWSDRHRSGIVRVTLELGRHYGGYSCKFNGPSGIGQLLILTVPQLSIQALILYGWALEKGKGGK